MKRPILRQISESLEEIMQKRGISAKELAQMSKIGYSSLIPILKGSRDFGVTKLVSIINALECSPEMVFQKVLAPTKNNGNYLTTTKNKYPIQYIAVFVSIITTTYCMVYEINSKTKKKAVLAFDLGCGQNPDEFIDRIANSIQTIIIKNFQCSANNKNIAVFTSVQQYEGTNNRIKIQNNGDNLFAKFVIESDVITNYRALLGNQNGICITINDGSVILYSTDHGKNFTKLQGYGFPIADTAGNHWLGCEAIKHVINVKENIESNTLLADKISTCFNDDVNLLAENVMLKPWITYNKVSSIVRELMCEEDKPRELVKESANLLLQKIESIDRQLQITLPLVLAGDLANIYKPFFPTKRISTYKDSIHILLLNYGLQVLQNHN